MTTRKSATPHPKASSQQKTRKKMDAQGLYPNITTIIQVIIYVVSEATQFHTENKRDPKSQVDDKLLKEKALIEICSRLGKPTTISRNTNLTNAQVNTLIPAVRGKLMDYIKTELINQNNWKQKG